MRHTVRTICAATIAALLASQAAAAPVCWSTEAADAARVRDLQAMLVSASQRCGATGVDVAADYAQFSAANRGAVAAMNQRLRAHFYMVDAASGAQQLEGFAAKIAARHELAKIDAAACSQAAMVARAAAGAHSLNDLVEVAKDRAAAPPLPGPLCPAPVADARPAPLAYASTER